MGINTHNTQEMNFIKEAISRNTKYLYLCKLIACRVGLEPTTIWLTVRGSTDWANGTLELPVRIELTTTSLQVRCATIALRKHLKRVKLQIVLNYKLHYPHKSKYRSNYLSDHALFYCCLARIRTSSLWSKIRYADHYITRHLMFIFDINSCHADRTRTCTLLFPKQEP